jgi:hypothetical protein
VCIRRSWAVVGLLMLLSAWAGPIAGQSAGDQFAAFLWDLYLREPLASGDLVLFPIESPYVSSLPPIVPLQAGIDQGVFALREIGDGYSDAVGVFARNRQFGFGMGGGVYGGGRQGRGAQADYMFQGGMGYSPYGGGGQYYQPYGRSRQLWGEQSPQTLAPPETQLDGRRVAGVAVPVLCVDRERWSEQWKDMVQTGLADTATRRFLLGDAPQRDVWRRVALARSRLGIQVEGSKSYNDIFADPSIAAALAAAATQLPASAFSPHTVGVVAMVRGRIQAMDLFGTPQLFRDCWPELVKSYALDTLAAPASSQPSATKAALFLADVVRSDAQLRPGIALGENVELSSPRVWGRGLSFEGELVHLAAFPR